MRTARLTSRSQLGDFLWDLFVELRKETVGTQRIRAQLIGFKITFVSAAAGLLLTRVAQVQVEALVLPAFAAIFFDFLIYSQSFSVKRIGHYCREFLEPQLRVQFSVPHKLQLWEEFVSDPRRKQLFLISGNLGITLLAAVIGAVALWSSPRLGMARLLLIFLSVFFCFDVWMAWHSRRSRFKA